MASVEVNSSCSGSTYTVTRLFAPEILYSMLLGRISFVVILMASNKEIGSGTSPQMEISNVSKSSRTALRCARENPT